MSAIEKPFGYDKWVWVEKGQLLNPQDGAIYWSEGRDGWYPYEKTVSWYCEYPTLVPPYVVLSEITLSPKNNDTPSRPEG